jgi:uncharacterized membrane protein YheB (UPF0754 family)
MVSVRDRVNRLNRRVGIGELAVGTVFALLLTTWLLIPTFPRLIVLRDILFAGFVGGFTDTVAIRMLFTKYWFLPGSGVLLKERDAIIVSLADTMEEHILNPSLVEEKIRQLSRDVDRDRIAEVVNELLDEVRGDLVAYIRASNQREQIVETLRREGGFWGSMADSLGLVTYELVADRLTAGIAREIETFQVTGEMVETAIGQFGSIEDFVLKPDNPFVVKHYGSDRSLAQIVFDQLDAKQLVVDKLSTYDAGQIRDIISDNIREHVAWLQVFGCLLGMVFGTIVIAVDFLM